MLKWWVALIIGGVTLLVGYIAGELAAYGAYLEAKKLLDEVGKELAEMKEIYDKCLTMERDRS